MELQFRIDGENYPVPTRESLNLDEHVLFYEWTGVDLESIDDQPVNARMIGAFMQMAYMRANPEVPSHLARRLIGKSNFESAMAAFAAADSEDDAGPPAPGSSESVQPGSAGSSGSPQGSSGTDSTMSSGQPTSRPVDSGQQPSATSATFDQTTSAV